MGTRCVTRIEDDLWDENEKPKTILSMYRQFDGYVDGGHGQELIDFLKDMKVVNGLGLEKENVANGMGCLAAQIIAHFKTEPGGIYITNNDDSQSYNYTVYVKDIQPCENGADIYLRIEKYGDIIFDDLVNNFNTNNLEIEDEN